MMNQEDIFRKIGLILEELQDQYAYLARNQQQLNELELELFMANANFLSDHVQIVRKLNSAKVTREIPEHTGQENQNVADTNGIIWENPSAAQQNSAPSLENVKLENTDKTSLQESKVETIAVEHTPNPEEEEQAGFQNPIIAESLAQPEPSTFEFILKDIGATDKFDFEEKSVDNIFDRILSPEEEQIIAEKQRAQEAQQQEEAQQDHQQQVKETEMLDEVGPEPFLVAKEESIIPPAATELQKDPVAERMITEAEPVSEAINTLGSAEALSKPMSLNERLASQLGKSPVSSNTDAQRSTLSDLKHGINLNDKMLYIKDLFNGYNLAYAEVIELLNKMPDFKTADTFLQNNYAEKNNWTGKSATVTKFYELLHQRFPVK
ncbi:hypothetical protein [Pedobacter gandavensis]|uniref:hypothetical protein n=1 Tax=Pedobacter gandavensis TaxID=2679963 RepID=UPI00292FA21E|nr:hypothetical protein [Pedobacter gandavensis]